MIEVVVPLVVGFVAAYSANKFYYANGGKDE